MTENEIREMYSRYANALNTVDIGKLSEVLGDDDVLNGHPVAREAVIAAISANIDAVPDMHWQLNEMLIVKTPSVDFSRPGPEPTIANTCICD